MPEQEPSCGPSNCELLVEYEAAQASAEHHDTLIWTITNTVWAANLVLLGFLLQPGVRELPDLLLATIAGLGILILIKAWTYAGTLRAVKKHKYDRCKCIEKQLGFRQHQTLQYPSGFQWHFYGLVTLACVGTWIYFAVAVLTAPGHTAK